MCIKTKQERLHFLDEISSCVLIDVQRIAPIIGDAHSTGAFLMVVFNSKYVGKRVVTKNMKLTKVHI